MHRTSRRSPVFGGAGLRDRRRAGRARHGARARPPRPAGAAARERRAGAAGRGAGAVAGGEPRSRDPPCAGDHRRAAARRRLEPLGRTLPAVRSGRFRGAALARRPAGLADRAGGARALARRRPAAGSPPATPVFARAAARGGGRRRPSASRASSAGATGRGSSSCTRPSSPRGPNLMVALGTTATGFADGAAARVAAVEAHVEGRGGGGSRAAVVLAAGGNESTRLLLAAQARARSASAGRRGRSGAATWGTSTARSPTWCFESRALHDGLDFHVDGHGSYVRRRLVPSPETQAAARLTTSPSGRWCRDRRTRHRSGPLSAVFLALSAGPLGRRLIAEPIRLKHVGVPPYRRGAHLRNVALDLPRTLGFAPAFLWRNRVARMRLPGFFLQEPGPALRTRVPRRAPAATPRAG